MTRTLITPYGILLIAVMICSVICSVPRYAFAEPKALLELPSFTLSIEKKPDSNELHAVVIPADSVTPNIQASVFTLQNPARLVFDFGGIKRPSHFEKLMGSQIIEKIRGGNFQGKQRLVIEMKGGIEIELLEYLQHGNTLLARLHAQKEEIVPSFNWLTDIYVDETRMTPIIMSYSYSLEASKTRTSRKQAASGSTHVSSPLSQLTTFTELLRKNLVVVLFPIMLLLVSGIVLFSLQTKKRQADTSDEYQDDEEIKLPTEIIELPTLAEAYRILGCLQIDGDHKLKKHYRRLLKAFHEDKLVSKDLPLELMTVSRREFDRVRAAFERLKIDRPTLQ